MWVLVATVGREISLRWLKWLVLERGFFVARRTISKWAGRECVVLYVGLRDRWSLFRQGRGEDWE